MWPVRWIKFGFGLLALLVVALRLNAQIDRITGKNFATRSEVVARHGMVCTSVPAATEVGIDILKHGGSAVDAAIATWAAQGLVEPGIVDHAEQHRASTELSHARQNASPRGLLRRHKP